MIDFNLDGSITVYLKKDNTGVTTESTITDYIFVSNVTKSYLDYE